MHTTVFLHEAIQALNIQKNKKYIDATYGEGGHTQEMVAQGAQVLAIDADINQVKKGKMRGHAVVRGQFGAIAQIARAHDFEPVHGVLFDYGLSMEQLARGGRGLSYKYDTEPLDMRISEEDEEETAANVLNSLPEEELVSQLMKYSEDRYAIGVGRKIVGHRRKKKLKTVGDLKEVINKTVPKGKERNKTYARIFQAVRIIVNNELEQIKRGLEGACKLLTPRGVVATITFHSLEDRVVKQFGRARADISMRSVDIGRVRELRSFERSAHLRILLKK